MQLRRPSDKGEYATAFDKADRLRHSMESLDGLGIGIHIEISIGMSEISRETKLDDAIKQADDNLLLAKRNGRNRVEPQLCD